MSSEEQPTAEAVDIKAIAMNINSSFSLSSKYTYYDGLSYQPCEKSCMISKNDFEYKVIMGTYFTKQDAFILQAIHELGYATVNSTLIWITLQKEKFPKKAIQAYTKQTLGARMQFLARQGLLAEYDYVTIYKTVEHVFVCHSYGHLFFRNKLDCFSLYDQSVLCRAEVEIFKRLAANAVSLAFAKYRNTKDILINNRAVNNSDSGVGYLYGLIKLENSYGEKMNLVIEPVHFSYDSSITSEEEWMEKVENRLTKLISSVEKLNEETPTKVIFCLENSKGLGRFTKLIESRELEFFMDSLYTSENVLNRNDSDLGQSFLLLKYKDGKPVFRPLVRHWMFEK